MGVKICINCSLEYSPKPMDFTSKYCSLKCKTQYYIKHDKRHHKSRKGSPYYHNVTKKDPILRQIHNDRKLIHSQEVQKWLSEYKLQNGCVDCGYREYACALQLDHTGPKTDYIMNLRSSIGRLKKEIQQGKCEVRCGNCHAIKTWESNNGTSI